MAYRLFWLFIKHVGYYIGTCFKASFPTAFAHEYNNDLPKRKSPLKKGPHAVNPLNSKTSLVNSTYLTDTTAFINIVLCVLIYCNSCIEIYCTGDLFLKCNITTHEKSLSSNNTFAFFATKRKVMDSINDYSTGLYKEKSNLWYPVLEGKCRVKSST
jgi:hypothetical protein